LTDRPFAGFAGLFLLMLTLVTGAVAQDSRPDAQTIMRNWYDVALELTRHTATYSPPVAARTYAYLGVTAYEAAVEGSDALVTLQGQLTDFAIGTIPHRETGAYDEAVVINAALAANIAILYSNTGPTGQRVIERASEKFRDLVIAGVEPDIITRSEAYGRAVAAAVLGWSEGDGGAVVENMGFPLEWELPKGDQYWVPTNVIVQQQNPLLPEWGTVRTLAAPNGQACALPSHPDYSQEPGSAFYVEAMEVHDRVKNATPEEMQVARFWSDDPMLSTTPPGHWISIGVQVSDQQQLSLDDTVDMFARLGIVMSDAFIACWSDKYVYNLIRPITYIKRVIDPKWEPILNTPPFPEYPSGHSTVSGAAGAVLTAFFGENFAFDDSTGSRDGRSARSFASFNAAADEAALSRLLGGIHFRAAIDNGLTQGRCIAEYTIALKTRS
jgi:hypothetical protein